MFQRIAKRYAQGLFEICEENKITNVVGSDLKKLVKLIDTSKEFRFLIKSPLIPPRNRQLIVKKILEKKIHAFSLTYLSFLEKKERLDLLKTIEKDFAKIRLQSQNILHAKITTSVSLNNHQLQVISEHLKLKFHSDIKLDLVIDQSTLGGIRIQIGDKVYDHTLQKKLEKFREKL